MKWGEIDPQSTWWEFKALTTTLSSSDVLMIKIVFQKIEKKKSGSSRETRDQALGWGMYGLTLYLVTLLVRIPSDSLSTLSHNRLVKPILNILDFLWDF